MRRIILAGVLAIVASSSIGCESNLFEEPGDRGRIGVDYRDQEGVLHSYPSPDGMPDEPRSP